MYFELTIDILHEFGIKEADDLPYDLDFLSGEEITKQVNDPLVFSTNASSKNSPPDFYGKGIPVMSEKFINLLEASGVDNLQKFPAIIKSDIDGAVWGNYFAINVIGVIKCADLSNSKYNEIFPGNYSFKELAIDVSLIKDALLFRLQESPSTIIIDGSVGNHIVANDPGELITGWDVYDIIQ